MPDGEPDAGADPEVEPVSAPVSGAPDTDQLLENVEVLLLGGPPVLTRRQVAEQVGVPLDVSSALWHSLGFPHAGDDDVVFTEADAQALGAARQLLDAGILDEESQAAMVRTWGRSFARLAEWQIALLASVAAKADDPVDKMSELAVDVVPLVESLQSYVWRRHLLSAAGRLLLRPSVDDATTTQAVGFVDIVGYTTQSRNLEQSELVALVEHFEELSTSVVTDHGGQLVKTIGDEVLYVCDDPVQAVEIALDLTGRNGDDAAYPEVRAGVAYGDVLSRLGDVFGPVVNIASRLTSLARPGTLLVDDGLHDALAEVDPDGNAYRLRRLRRTSVKGYHRLESWRVKRTS